MLSRAGEAGGGGTKFAVSIVHLGEPQTHEWEELPEGWAALLPGKPKGRLYIVREHVRESEDKPSGRREAYIDN